MRVSCVVLFITTVLFVAVIARPKSRVNGHERKIRALRNRDDFKRSRYNLDSGEFPERRNYDSDYLPSIQKSDDFFDGQLHRKGYKHDAMTNDDINQDPDEAHDIDQDEYDDEYSYDEYSDEDEDQYNKDIDNDISRKDGRGIIEPRVKHTSNGGSWSDSFPEANDGDIADLCTTLCEILEDSSEDSSEETSKDSHETLDRIKSLCHCTDSHTVYLK